MTTPLIQMLTEVATGNRLMTPEAVRALCGEAAREIARLTALLPAERRAAPVATPAIYTPEAIAAMLDAANPYQRAGAWLNPAGSFTPEQIEAGLTDVSPIVRLAVWERCDLTFTLEQINRGRDDDSLSVRNAAEYAFARAQREAHHAPKRRAANGKSSVPA